MYECSTLASLRLTCSSLHELWPDPRRVEYENIGEAVSGNFRLLVLDSKRLENTAKQRKCGNSNNGVVSVEVEGCFLLV